MCTTAQHGIAWSCPTGIQHSNEMREQHGRNLMSQRECIGRGISYCNDSCTTTTSSASLKQFEFMYNRANIKKYIRAVEWHESTSRLVNTTSRDVTTTHHCMIWDGNGKGILSRHDTVSQRMTHCIAPCPDKAKHSIPWGGTLCHNKLCSYLVSRNR